MNARRYLAPFYSLLLTTAACTGVTVGSGAGSSGCYGGANANQREPGDGKGGVQLAGGDIAVAPSGEFVIFKGQDELAVGWPASGTLEKLPVTLPTRLAFSKTRTVVYVASASDGSLHAIDVRAKEELWKTPIDDTSEFSLRLAPSKDDTRLAAAWGDHITLIDAKTGTPIHEETLPSPVVDLAILPDDARAIAVTFEQWPQNETTPTTTVAVMALDTGATHDFQVPNCASPLAITADGNKAFLSPTTCNKDPVSYLDLTPGKEQWVKNLPGFGPLALAPVGNKAVAFLDAQNVDDTLFDDPKKIPPSGKDDPRYYLMTLDTDTLTYDFTAVGDKLPRYAITPDGKVLLVDAAGQADTEPVRLFDIETRSLKDVIGPNFELDNFVLSSDAEHAYVLYSGLFDINIAAAVSSPLDVEFTPTNINIAPDNETLYLRRDEGAVCIYSIAAQSCAKYFEDEPVVVLDP